MATNTVSVELDQEAIREEVISRAVASILETFHTSEAIERVVAEQRNTMIEEALRPKVDEIITQAFDQKVTPTSGWGEPKGEPITIRERIVELAQAQLKLSDNRPGYGGGRRETALDEYLGRAVQEAVKNDLTAEFEEARKTLSEALNKAITEILTKALDRRELRF